MSRLSSLIIPSVKRILEFKSVATTRQVIQTAFSKYLLLTNVSLSMVLSGSGDVIQQKYQIAQSGQVKQLNLSRTIQMTATGATVGALCHYWYLTLDGLLPGRTIKIVLKKLAVDQLLFSPVCLSVFFVTLALSKKFTEAVPTYFNNQVNGHLFTRDVVIPSTGCTESMTASTATAVKSRNELAEFLDEVRQKGLMLYLAEWLVWPPAQLINFYFLPTRYRVLYDNSVSLVFDVFTSHVCFDAKFDDNKDYSAQIHDNCESDVIKCKSFSSQLVKQEASPCLSETSEGILNNLKWNNNQDNNISTSGNILQRSKHLCFAHTAVR